MSEPTSGPGWWMQECLDAGYERSSLNKLDLMSLYLLCGKIIHDHVVKSRPDFPAALSPAEKAALRQRIGA